MDIYWIKDKRKCGPSTVPDVISLIQMGELSPESLGWHAGCAGWTPLRELPALADFLNKQTDELSHETGEPANAPEEPLPDTQATEPLTQLVHPPASQADAGEDTPEEPQPEAEPERVYLPSPSARLFARLVDLTLYTLGLYAWLYLTETPYNLSWILSANPLLWLPMLLLEAFFISQWGRTPGKALMGITVRNFKDGGRVSFMRAFWRALIVFVLGIGMMIPLLLPLMLLLSYWKLRRMGITSWDARCSTLPVQKSPTTPSRYVLAVVILYSCTILIESCLRPWYPYLLADIEKEQPEAAGFLREMLPPEALIPPADKTEAGKPAADSSGSTPGELQL